MFLIYVVHSPVWPRHKYSLFCIMLCACQDLTYLLKRLRGWQVLGNDSWVLWGFVKTSIWPIHKAQLLLDIAQLPLPKELLVMFVLFLEASNKPMNLLSAMRHIYHPICTRYCFCLYFFPSLLYANLLMLGPSEMKVITKLS